MFVLGCVLHISIQIWDLFQKICFYPHIVKYDTIFMIYIHTQTHTQTQSNIIKLENSRIGMQQNSPVSVYKHIIFANLSSTIVIQTKLKGGNGNSLKL